MDCPQALENLSAHLDNALDSATREELEEHLRSCGRCQSELDALRACVEAVSSMDRISAPSGFLTKVHERIDEGSGWKRLLGKLMLPWRVKIPLHAAGVVAAVILIMLMLPARETTKRVLEAPEQPAPEISLETPRPAAPPQHAQETHQPSPITAGMADSARLPQPRADGVIELVLIMEPSHQGMTGGLEQSPREAAQPSASLRSDSVRTKPAPMPGTLGAQSHTSSAKMQEIFETGPNEKKAQKARLQERERAALQAPGDKAAGGANALAPVSQVEEIIRRAGGTVTSKEADPATGKLRSLLALIPSPSYPDLIAMLQEKGRLQDPPSEISIERPDGLLRIRIRLDHTAK